MDNVIQMLGTIATTLAMWFPGRFECRGTQSAAKNAVPKNYPAGVGDLSGRRRDRRQPSLEGCLSPVCIVGGLLEGLGIAAVSPDRASVDLQGSLKRGEKFLRPRISSAAGTTPEEHDVFVKFQNRDYRLGCRLPRDRGFELRRLRSYFGGGSLLRPYPSMFGSRRSQ
jgi:hypothetical protein